MANPYTWDEFFERFVGYYDEFLFYYKGKEINISTSGFETGFVYLAYGTREKGYAYKDYKSPREFLVDRCFDGKTLYEIWDELE